MQVEGKPSRAKLLLSIALILIVVGGLLAHLINTDGVTLVRDVRFIGTKRTLMSARSIFQMASRRKLPPQASFVSMDTSTRASSRPASLSSYHGVATWSSPLTRPVTAIPTRPLSPMLLVDLHGLKYLSSLDIVDKTNIGLEGHSMGGWAVGIAAAYMPTSYKSIVLEGSGTGGIFGVPAGNTTWPRNLCVVLSKWDEFSKTMWGSVDPKAPDPVDMNVPANVADSVRLKAQFGTTSFCRRGPTLWFNCGWYCPRAFTAGSYPPG